MNSSSPKFLFKHKPFVLFVSLLLAFLFQSCHPVARAGVTSGDGGAVYGKHGNCVAFDDECGREETNSAVASGESGTSRVISRSETCRDDNGDLREAEARAVAAEKRAQLAEGRAEDLNAELRGALRDVARLENAITEMEEQLAMEEKRCGERRAEVGRQLKECIGGREQAKAQLHECGEQHLGFWASQATPLLGYLFLYAHSVRASQHSSTAFHLTGFFLPPPSARFPVCIMTPCLSSHPIMSPPSPSPNLLAPLQKPPWQQGKSWRTEQDELLQYSCTCSIAATTDESMRLWKFMCYGRLPCWA
ncbi:unnamed protein product [Closterium sp. Naga37s-1]|nr:unnamed protein product [Closterium sp. Naga37s-1]